jgi:hypothetical protein
MAIIGMIPNTSISSMIVSIEPTSRESIEQQHTPGAVANSRAPECY